MLTRRNSIRLLPLLGMLSVALWLHGAAPAGDAKKESRHLRLRGQKAAKDVKRIVFVADTAPHGGRGNHEFLAAAIYLARTINANYPNAYRPSCTTQGKWPKDLKHADAVIVLLNHGGSAVNPAVKEATATRAGFMAIHYGVEVNKGEQGQNFLKWMGGYFETFWSVNPWWTPNSRTSPSTSRPAASSRSAINDEWYYHMRFVDDMKGVTPILSAVPPLKTITRPRRQEAELARRQPGRLRGREGRQAQVMAWAYERPDGGRGFGFTGLHKHANLGDDSFRTLLLNAVAWVSKLPVPDDGVPSKTLSRDDLEKLIDDGKLAVKRRGI